MKPIKILYWLRFLLGIAAAVVCIGYGLATNTVKVDVAPNVFINGFSIAIIVYIISYWIIKPVFVTKLDKPQKIFTTGIFLYFVTWLVFWVLFNTLLIAA
jgi:uncharacterized membrane protein YvlD (DUF360 family)